MSNRKKCLVSDKMGELLIKQLVHELKNYNLYKTFASYFDVEGIAEIAEYWVKRAQEEHDHHSWIYDYLTEANYKVVYPVIPDNDITIDDYSTPFTASLDREIETTQLIYAIYEQAMLEKDYMTGTWLYEKLIKEQVDICRASEKSLAA